ncbi:MAG: two-component system sensor histidine kinase PilS (NtrC family) [Reinekea sp.]|jgi:two-component system sensor histidine kinase PilS (NtrC family)
MSFSIRLSQPVFRVQQLLFAFGIFRLILATGLCVLALLPETAKELLPSPNPESMQLATLVYLILTILGMLLTVNEQLSKTPITVLLITDILLLMLILRYSGGVDSGFGSLMLISVGIGGLLLPLRQSLLVAATATSSVVYTEILPLDGATRDLLQAALLGLGYFAETLFLQYVGQRVKKTEQLARVQADTILDLRHLNELIVQRLRTGIIVVTSEGAIRLMNDAARDLLKETDNPPFWLSQSLQDRLASWQRNPHNEIEPIQADTEHPGVSVNIARLQTTETSDLIIFLEDSGRMQQQAQQLKLASLGRLTASIAHEIRNPLGAISHAAQLLDEAPALAEADKRLLAMIHTHSQRVNTIIETILELSRRRPKQISSIAAAALIEQCLAERELETERHQDQIEIAVEVNFNMEIDINQIKQALHNLIDNGLYYSGLHVGQRRLRLCTGELSGSEQYYLDIEDEGLGVPGDQIKNLFEPFYTTEHSGTGLGLYIAKELCEANRLKLSYVQNRRGGCFRIVFPHAFSQRSER